MTERMTHLQYLPPEMPVSPQSLQRQGGSSKYDIAVRAVRDRRRADLDAGRLVWQTALADNDRLYAARQRVLGEQSANDRVEVGQGL